MQKNYVTPATNIHAETCEDMLQQFHMLYVVLFCCNFIAVVVIYFQVRRFCKVENFIYFIVCTTARCRRCKRWLETTNADIYECMSVCVCVYV